MTTQFRPYESQVTTQTKLLTTLESCADILADPFYRGNALFQSRLLAAWDMLDADVKAQMFAQVDAKEAEHDRADLLAGL